MTSELLSQIIYVKLDYIFAWHGASALKCNYRLLSIIQYNFISQLGDGITTSVQRCSDVANIVLPGPGYLSKTAGIRADLTAGQIEKLKKTAKATE